MRERDDEDLAHDQLEPPPPGQEHQSGLGDRARGPVRPTDQGPEPTRFVSPSRERYYDLQRELAAVHKQHDALPIQEAQSAIALGKTIALNEESRQIDRWPRGPRDLSAHRWRKHEREQRLKRLRDLQAKYLDAVPDPQAVLDRARELADRQTDLARERHRQREHAITEELDHQPPWLEQTLGPEPEHRDRREDWQDTARQIAGHRIDQHITDPHTALHQDDHHLGLAQTIKETRVALGLDAPKRDHDIGYGW
jgi:hypothetical protein